MALRYFHCTDGVDLIVDRHGRERSDEGDLRQARAIAHEIMHAVPAYDAWEDWSVHVYDERGQIAIVPFPSPEAGMLEAA